MFEVGDKVVYPMHGAGVIEAIEEKEVLGERRDYYVMRLPIGDMTVMIPTKGAEDIGIREVVDQEQLERVFSILRADESIMSANWNRRYRANTEKLKTGDIFEVAEVVRNLTIRDRAKGLSTGERKMLDTARQILLSEMVLAKSLTEDEAEDVLEEVLANHVPSPDLGEDEVADASPEPVEEEVE